VTLSYVIKYTFDCLYTTIVYDNISNNNKGVM